MDKNYRDMGMKLKYCKTEEQKRSWKNAARLKCCSLHHFDWRSAMKKESIRRKAQEEQYGVAVGIRSIIWCRCKNCGGKVLTLYAMAYMDGVTAAVKSSADSY